MKTKICAAVAALILLMACGSNNSNSEKNPADGAEKTEKFRIKTSNGMYLSVKDSFPVADQPDPTKAEVFEKVSLGNGKWAIKTSSGKFLSDDRSNYSKVDAIRDKADGWEEFEIIAVDPITVHIKSSVGKYVCADQSHGNFLFADKDKADSWETFVFEPL